MAPDLTPSPPLPRGEGEPELELHPSPFATLVALALPAAGRVAEGRERVLVAPDLTPQPPLPQERGSQNQLPAPSGRMVALALPALAGRGWPIAGWNPGVALSLDPITEKQVVPRPLDTERLRVGRCLR